jgi:arylsulfatase A-like enzyme
LSELTGQAIPNKTDGISFLAELKGNTTTQKKHDYIYFEYPENGGQVAIRNGDWKGVRTNVRKDPKAPWQVFDLRNDRNETTDVAGKHPDLVKQFDAVQKNEHQHSHIREWEFIDPKFKVKNSEE